MRRLWVLLVACCAGMAFLAPAAAGASRGDRPWRDTVPFTNRIVSAPARGGGYPTPTGTYVPGTCRPGRYDANFSESVLAAAPASERLVGASKFFFERFSASYNFTIGSFDITRTGSRSTVLQGYDCTTTGTQASPPTWTSVTDPNLAFDSRGRVYDIALAFNWYRLDGNVYASYSDDYGHRWIKGNGGRPIEVGPVDAKNGEYLDKPWVAVNRDPGSRYRDHVYAIWAVRRNASSALHVAVSRDRGRTFSRPTTLPTPAPLSATNPWPYIAVDGRGDVYAVYATYGPAGAARFWTVRSTDDGRTWSRPRPAGPPTRVDLDATFPGTRVHVGAPESFAASPTRPGHLYLAWEELRGGQLDIRFTASTDGGRTWTAPRLLNDDRSGTDQVQPALAVGSRGSVAVAFYDKRAACPRGDRAILRQHWGARNTCFVVSLQPLVDRGTSVAPLGGNRNVSAHGWDPDQPAQTVGGLPQQACSSMDRPCTEIFIGDYFGIAITGTSVYTLSVTTSEPSRTRADSGGPVYYQQQVLAQVRRSALGL